MKIIALLFKAIEFSPLRRNALAGHRRRQIEEEGQIGLQMTMHPLLKLLELTLVEPRPPALIGIGRIAEAIADDPVAARQRGSMTLK